MDTRTFFLSRWSPLVLGLSVAAGAWGCGAHVPPPPPAAVARTAAPPREVAIHPSPTAPMALLPSEMEKERQTVLEQVEANFQQHEAEPLDPAWGGKSTASLRSDLERLRQGRPFSLLEVDCRSNSCKAVLEWPSYPQAIADASALVHHYYEVNCARTVLMTEPRELEQPYRLRILFQCG